MALPDGWTATVERYELDRSTSPPSIAVELRFDGPGNVSFRVPKNIPVRAVGEFGPRAIVQRLVWPEVAAYVMRTIADRQPADPVANPAASIVGQTVALS